jgi:hypothetical protein
MSCFPFILVCGIALQPFFVLNPLGILKESSYTVVCRSVCNYDFKYLPPEYSSRDEKSYVSVRVAHATQCQQIRKRRERQ